MARRRHELDEKAGYDALSSGSVMVSGPSRDRLVVTGSDRERFVNGLVTCDVKALVPGRGALGFFTKQDGRVLADVVVWARDESLELDVPRNCAELIGSHLRRYRVADRIEVEIPEKRTEILLAGAAAAGTLAEVLEDEPPSRYWSRRECSGVDVYSEGWIGAELFRLRGESDATVALASRLRTMVGGFAPRKAVDALRIERGRPWFGVDFGDESLPQETGLVDEAVSFTKGCYLGQEIVARLHYRGQAPRQLRGLKLEGPGLLEVGNEVLAGSEVVGAVSTASFSPRLGTWIALARLRRRADPGTISALSTGASVSIVELPFVRPDEDGSAE
jgi:folate-binding protein YgfZ